MIPYYSIDPTTLEITNTNSLSRLIDGLGFRYRWATEELTENEITFRPVEGSQNMEELIIHIYGLVTYADITFGGESKPLFRPKSFEDLRQSTLGRCLALSNRFKEMTDEELAGLELKNGKSVNPKLYWHMLNGPIADALTHVGQITSWRRIAGNPQPDGVDVFRGEKN